MKKICCFVLSVIFALALCGALLCLWTDIWAIGWKKTTLTITAIGLPDGIVFGDYVDANGTLHQNEPALSWHGSRINVDQYYGQEITILCGTEKGEVLDYDRLIKRNILYFGLTLLTGFLLYFGFIRRKKP